MDPELTKEEFEGFWPIVESEKNARIGKTRQRGTDNPELGYAIYRERKTKKTPYKEIIKKLEEGNLYNCKIKIRKDRFNEEQLRRTYSNYAKAIKREG